ncbi:MAG: hypothetical protein M3388_12105 [Acidobacteriota bacterium]|nr:hypothetical protein [Acidobacteriota bacterium]
MSRKLSVILLILCFGNLFASAQSVKDKPAPTGLTLEMTFLKDRPPAYMMISESLATARSYAFGAYNLVPGFRTSAERPPVQAVEFTTYLENGTVKVKVKVHIGQKSFEKEENVAVYSMRENERTSIKELANFGVEPFEIAVVRVTPSVSALPAIENKTTSLQITAIEPNFSTLPTYNLSLLNASSKAVRAFTCETIENGRIRRSGMPQKKYGVNLIEPGATYAMKEIQIPLENKKAVEGEIPKPTSQQTFVISSVIFADGSYEGDASRAAQFYAYTLGRKMQVKQIIALLESFENNSSAFNFNKFVEQSAKLETKISESEFDNFLKRLPSLTENEKVFLRDGVEGLSDDVKIEFTTGTQKRLQELEPVAARVYLKALKEKYQNWLALLP